MIYSFICFFIGKFVANFLMTRFKAEKVLIAYSILGALTLLYVVFTAVYAAVFVSVLFGPCWATIYAGTLDTVDNKYTEVAGAIIVMSIVGAAVVPALQGFVSDHLGSMQHAFVVSLLCFVYVGFYFWGELRNKQRVNAATLANNES